MSKYIYNETKHVKLKKTLFKFIQMFLISHYYHLSLTVELHRAALIRQ